MRNKITIYGDLAKVVGNRVFHAKINNAIDAYRFLKCNFPELQTYMLEKNYIVKVGDKNINETELFYPVGNDDIKIVPVAAGAKSVGKVLTGGLLIGASFLFPGAGMFGTTGLFGAGGAATKGLAGLMTGIGSAISGVGAAMVLGGIDQMITQTPEDFQTDIGSGANANAGKSMTFNGIVNSSASGIGVPICYGEVFTGSIVVSAGIDTTQKVGKAKLKGNA
tara:strand:+ start:1501 stop:2166 length:666 start_codon:yes stop_codon:yes gene_type:complete